MKDLKPCPFCGGEAVKLTSIDGFTSIGCLNCNPFYGVMIQATTEAEAIAAWNNRAAMEFDNWFYLPKPKEPIAEVAKTTHTWDGLKVKTDVFYQVQEQAAINWAKELDEHIIKRICEVWNSRAERTCKQEERGWCTEGDHARVWLTCGHDCMVPTVQDLPNYCPNCGYKVVK